MRAGMTWHYAEAMPAALFLLLAVALATILPVPSPVGIGLLFAIGFLTLGGSYAPNQGPPWGLFYGTRPEGHLLGAWLSGLLLLENGRLREWNRPLLFFERW